VTAGPQATFVVEYRCDQFCRIEVELTSERGDVTQQQLREKADGLHRREHEPGPVEASPVFEQETLRRPAATLFRSAPGSGVDRRR
jgi:hypothetical protein